MSIVPENCYNIVTWKPLPEDRLNIFQMNWKNRTLGRLYYNGDVTTRTFMITYKACHRDMHATLGMMERRLDNVLFRSLFAESIFEARRMVSAGAVTLNGTPNKIPSHFMKDGDMLQIVPEWWEHARKIADDPWARCWAFIPRYLEVSRTAMATVFLQDPQIHEIPSPYPQRLIDYMAAFYSRKGIKPEPKPNYWTKFKK